MTMDVKRFKKLRPYLFHLTAKANIDSIRESKKLRSAAYHLNQAGQTELIQIRRADSTVVTVGGQDIHIRDQSPLYENNIDFKSGWTFPRFLECLNGLVFFWPGSYESPIPYGQRHFERYSSEPVFVLIINTSDMFKTNSDPLFCKFNSGSPRCNDGKGSPRGPGTFCSADSANFTPGSVKEVVFKDLVLLPDSTMIADPHCLSARSLLF